MKSLAAMGQDPAFMEHIRAQIQSPEWHGHVDIVTGRKDFPNTRAKSGMLGITGHPKRIGAGARAR